MMDLYELWKHFRFLSDLDGCSPEERGFLEKFLSREHALKEQKKREHLLRMSGIRRVKLLSDFDWAFNPKMPEGEGPRVHADGLAEEAVQSRAHWA